MRFFLLSFIVLLTGISSAQNPYDFYFEVTPESEIENIQVEKKKTGELIFHTNSAEFSKFLLTQKITQLQKAYPQANSRRLQRIYSLSLQDSVLVENFKNRKEIQMISAFDQPDLRNSYPNDYFDDEGIPNRALDLIRAPQAWQITKGDSSVVVGIVDRGYDKNHEDLEGQIIKEIKLGNKSKSDHGTTVAGSLAAKTNNGKGFSSIGYHTKMMMTTGIYSLEQGLDSISKIPGIRIINASWGFCGSRTSQRLKRLDSIIKKVRERDVLVVAAAGNGIKMRCKLNEEEKIHGYHYPASYDLDNVISVTSVGVKFPYGHYTETTKNSGWQDCHEHHPFSGYNISDNCHTHNDRVDITAPGIKVNILKKNNEYSYGHWGTSQSAPIVAGAAALMLAVNPDLTAKQLKEILLNTADDIYHLPCNEEYKGLLGKGRLNAYRAVLTAKCMKESDGKLDLMIRDAVDDFGVEPYAGNNYGWQSPDIWIRNKNDGQIYSTNQTAQFSRKEKNYIYVRITNNSCQTSSGEEKVTLYWGKEEDYLEKTIENKNLIYKEKRKLLGEKILSEKIPKLQPGEETIVEIPWKVPNPRKYKKTENPNSFVLMAEIIADQDEIKTEKEEALVDKIINNNNLAWKRIKIER